MAAILEFGPFRLDADTGILFRGAEPTPLGQRAVLLLALLVRRAGAPVSKDDLIEAAWPAQAIEESNLTVQMAAVRRALADASGEAQWIETLPRRGYRYVGPAATLSDPEKASAPSLTLPDRPSIAVLPFTNLSGDAAQDYFADGMVDDIITGLSRINWLFVIARNSTFTYKGRAVDVKQIGRELGVRYVLEGSVRKTGGNVRITGQLIDASTGMHVWAERYDRQSDDIFALQDDIAISAVGAIAPSLRRAEINRVKRKRPDSLDAYDLVLRAQPDVDSGMPQQVTQALVLLDRATMLEPSYALAHGNAAMCHHCLFLRAGLQETNRTASIMHARSAIAHGQDDAVALTLAGFSIGMDGHDRSAAFTALDAALSISPSSALTYILGSVMLGWGGDADRAIEWSERACGSARSIPGPLPLSTHRRWGTSTAAGLKRPVAPLIAPFTPIRATASRMCNWRRHSQSSADCTKQEQPQPGCWNCTPPSATAVSSRASTAPRRLQRRLVRPSVPRGCRSNRPNSSQVQRALNPDAPSLAMTSSRWALSRVSMTSCNSVAFAGRSEKVR
jgi:TolB-like protein